jgi:hypothetical protein
MRVTERAAASHPRLTQSAGATGSIDQLGSGNRDSIALLDDIGGKWEGEGLGKGLEERLETLMMIDGKVRHPWAGFRHCVFIAIYSI